MCQTFSEVEFLCQTWIFDVRHFLKFNSFLRLGFSMSVIFSSWIPFSDLVFDARHILKLNCFLRLGFSMPDIFWSSFAFLHFLRCAFTVNTVDPETLDFKSWKPKLQKYLTKAVDPEVDSSCGNDFCWSYMYWGDISYHLLHLPEDKTT